jgi:hypothetical protein
MVDEIRQWEYRGQKIGGTLGTKDELIQDTLDEWGDGWEAVNVYTLSGSGSVPLPDNRPLPNRGRRMRTMPQA